MDAEHIEITVPILVTQDNEAQANIYESTDPQVNNLFDQFNYNNQLSFHESILRCIQREDPDNVTTSMKINNSKTRRRTLKIRIRN